LLKKKSANQIGVRYRNSSILPFVKWASAALANARQFMRCTTSSFQLSPNWFQKVKSISRQLENYVSSGLG